MTFSLTLTLTLTHLPIMKWESIIIIIYIEYIFVGVSILM